MKSPCIGVCSTGIGDSVCRGCKRFSHEIIHWNSYTDEERQAIQTRLDTLLSQVVKARVQVTSEELLAAQIQHQRIRTNQSAGPYCWVFDLLKAGATQIDALENYGCKVLPEHESLSLTQLKESIDQDFFVLSSVHYERYFQ